MKVSIITVCFNSVETIRDTIESVLAQEYEKIEYIVVDGVSRDGTLEILQEYESRIDHLIVENDSGIYDAMNKGIRIATGDVVGIINSDDVLAGPDTVTSIVSILNSNPDCDGCYGDLQYVKRDNIRSISRHYSSKGFSQGKIRFGLMLPHPTLYVRREAFNSYGYYKLTYRVAADFELITRFLRSGVSLIRNPEIMVFMREGGISSDGFWWRVHQNFEIVRACRENGIYTNIFFLLFKIPVKLFGYINALYFK